MKTFQHVLGSLIAGLLVTAVIAVATLLSLMASTPDTGQRSEGFFGALFFEAAPMDATTFSMNIGVADPLPLVISTVVIAVIVMVAIAIHGWLKVYRQQLIAA